MNDPDHHDQLRNAFHRVVSASEHTRQHTLEEIVLNAPELKHDLESLLQFENKGSNLEHVASQWRSKALMRPTLKLPERLGRCRLIERIGRGGMGDVYLAEQENPRRTVAVKILHRSLADERHRRRFELESEILGRLDHPGIASVLEAGSEENITYFVMEYVDGLMLTDFVEQNNCDLITRVKLLIDLCDAVAHAHQRGVVHRDLKPANILVTSDGALRVLDFGVARVSCDLQLPTLETRDGELVGTLQYMCPEQIDGDPDIDVRADVYAIGIIAYELLTGQHPLELPSSSLSAAIELIRQGSVPFNHHNAQSLPDDLKIIISKAMRPARNERYQNAIELAMDFGRWLRHEPIMARPPNKIYQLMRFVRRNRSIVTACSLFAVLLIGAVASIWFAFLEMQFQKNLASTANTTIREQRDEARTAGDISRRQKDAYLSLFALAEVDVERAEALAASMPGSNDINAILAHVYAARGDFVRAKQHTQRALAHWTSGEESRHDLLLLLLHIDDSNPYSDRLIEWRDLNMQLLQRAAPKLATDIHALEELKPDSWSHEFDAEAAHALLNVIEQTIQRLHDDDFAIQLAADRLEWLAHICSGRRAHTFARNTMEITLRARRRHLLEPSPRLVWSRIRLLKIQLRAGQYEDAENNARQMYQILLPILSDNHVQLAVVQSLLGRALVKQDRCEEAADLLQQASPRLLVGMGAGARTYGENRNDFIAAAAALEQHEIAEFARQQFVANVAAGSHRHHWQRIRKNIPAQYAELGQAAHAALGQKTRGFELNEFKTFLDLLQSASTDNAKRNTVLTLINASRGWVDVWVDSGGSLADSHPILNSIQTIAIELEGHPQLLTELNALRIVHESRLATFEVAQAQYDDAMSLIEQAPHELAWSKLYVQLAFGRTLVEHGRADESLDLLQQAFRHSVQRYGEGGYNTQFVREVLSLAIHAGQTPTDAFNHDVTELENAIHATQLQPRRLSMTAWQIARQSGHSQKTYQRALSAATLAAEEIPKSWLSLRSLAAAQYRCDQVHECLATLEQAMNKTKGERAVLRLLEALCLQEIDSPKKYEARQHALTLASDPEFRLDPIVNKLATELRSK